ncbi:golgin subfamily A member 4-like [Ischnura elegans]|uniref:golgin subfamily A member 4-like n=1 Tax=Ischnura elegans TaxID=197161 RepID=UPI001ED872ED|nr:golgin subfamily A member 4-like [Ischnura elegans]
MFKKLKDKIAEEVKISPKLQASVQQFAQAMVSPSSSISSIQESTSNDNFSIMEESEVSETPRNSPEKDNSFQRIDLREDVISTPPRFPSVPRSRRSSASSMMSDVSSLFPVYESPNNAYHFQSDLESTSEIDDITGSASHLQSISKEQLLLAYRKTQSRYHKYKGRYVDLARHFKELERQNSKIKAVLTETQDRALRKIAELKEQCALEQKAKAHLEDALRNDLEEKDHLIDTLKTKVKLLKSEGGGTSKRDWSKDKDVGDDLLVDVSSRRVSESDSQFSIQSENSLQDKISQLENLVAQYKQSLKENDEKVQVLTIERAKLDSSQTSLAKEVQSLKSELETQRKREEEAALSLAENKMQVHRELESREEESKKLKALVAKLQEELRSHKKGGGAESASMSTSGDGTAKISVEDTGAGGDGLPANFPATSELLQLKEVLRSKYREVEVLAAENGKLRASLLLSKCRSNGSVITLEDEELSQNQRESTLSEALRGGGRKDLMDGFENWMDEMVSLEHSDSDSFLHKVESKDASDLEVSATMSNFNESVGGELFMKQQHFKGELGASKTQSEPFSEKKWELKYGELKGELHRLLKEEEEMKELLALNSSQLEPRECSDDGYRASESGASLVESLSSVLSEKKKLKEEVCAANAKLKGVVKECEEMKGLYDSLSSEKKVLMEELKHSKDEVCRLKSDVEGLQSKIKELETDKSASEDLAFKCKGISRDYENLKGELDRFHAESVKERESLKSKYNAEVSLALATLEGKEQELQNVKSQLQAVVSSAADQKRKGENDLSGKYIHLEEELRREKELRLLAENKMNSFQTGLCKDFVSTLCDGRSILHEAMKSMAVLEKEVDQLKAQCEGFRLQEEETRKATKELMENRDQKLEGLLKHLEKSRADLESATAERDEAKRKLKEELQRAAVTVSEMEALMLKKHEAESRALKAENDLKVVREMEEKAKVEADEATYEQAAMRRSWEMQREQIESMSREIEGLKKAEGDLIKVLKEVKDDAKSKEMEVKRMVEESTKERKAWSQSEEKLIVEIASLKKSAEEGAMREEQAKKELEKMKEVANELKAKVEACQKELEVSLLETKTIKKSLDAKEVEEAKNTEAIKTLKEDLGVAINSEVGLTVIISDYMKEVDSLKELLTSRDAELDKLKGENNDLVAVKAQFESQLVAFKSEEEELLKRETKLLQEITALKAEKQSHELLLQDSKAKLEGEESCRHDLQERIRALEAAQVEQSNLKTIMEERVNEVSQLQDKLREAEGVNKGLRMELEQALSIVAESKKSAPTKGEEEVKLESELKALREERDEGVKRLNAADEKIRDLEGRMVSLSGHWEAERRELEGKISELKEELRVKANAVTSEEGVLQLEEELRSVLMAKDSLEKCLVVAQKEAQDKARWESRAQELESLMDEMKRDYAASSANQDVAHQEELSSFSEKMEAEVDYIRRQLMSEIKGLREELTLKGNEYDQLLEDHNKILNEREFELEKLKQEISGEQEKNGHIAEEEASKWMSKISEMEEKHKEIMEALKIQWEAEKRDLEITSKVAVAAVESGTGSMSYLKRQIQAQARELSETKRKYNAEILELRHLLSLQKRSSLNDSERSTLDDSTELEYLRNILYEYMMGKEPMVLARVIAAVVKFDDEQTKKILIKEEQKQTLLGQFGLT